MNTFIPLGYIFLILGVFLTITTMIGFARFDNIYTRIHISTTNDMLGIPLAIVGTAFLFLGIGDIFTAVKLMFGVVIWYIIAPVTSYILIKIVYFYKNESSNEDSDDE